MVAMGYVDNDRFARNLIRRCQEAGQSRQTIASKLKLAGLKPSQYLDTDEPLADEEDTALIYARKKRLTSGDAEQYKKNLAKLARAGFSYDVAKKVLSRLANTEEQPSKVQPPY
jgi:SOS response regulatory protein OraA/RecX